MGWQGLAGPQAASLLVLNQRLKGRLQAEHLVSSPRRVPRPPVRQEQRGKLWKAVVAGSPTGKWLSVGVQLALGEPWEPRTTCPLAGSDTVQAERMASHPATLCNVCLESFLLLALNLLEVVACTILEPSKRKVTCLAYR